MPSAVLRMDPGYQETAPKQLFSFKSPADVAQYVVGSDADIGGYSNARLDFDERTRAGRFFGELRTEVKPSMQVGRHDFVHLRG